MNKYLKWTLIVVGGLIVAGFIAYQVLMMYTKSHSPQETVTFSSGDLELSVVYCRPYKKGRDIFGGLEPYGKVWRTGANDATIFSTNKDITIDGQALAAGEYSLWTRPGESSWDVIFNSETGQWGVTGPSGEDNRQPDLDVLETNVPVIPTSQVIEQFTIRFTESDVVQMILEWDDTSIAVSIN